jgi:hypothetical protein
MMRASENRTSSAVTGLPLWKVIPSRRHRDGSIARLERDDLDA